LFVSIKRNPAKGKAAISLNQETHPQGPGDHMLVPPESLKSDPASENEDVLVALGSVALLIPVQAAHQNEMMSPTVTE
jgi:hypothetical protein